MSRTKSLRIGAGAAFAGDRIEPAVEIVAKGEIDYLVFECLAERTVALAQLARLSEPGGGYDPMLERRMRLVLPMCIEKGIRIVSNMGAANPLGAAEKIAELAPLLGIDNITIAAVVGDDVLPTYRSGALALPDPVDQENLISANAYIGSAAIVEALDLGADVVVAGRVADPSLFLAPMVHEFAWSLEDWPTLGKGTVIGHLLECAGQVTGGYFADPGCKDVDNLARLGFPIAEVAPDGNAIISKVPGSGGRITLATCKEQLLYELHDPTAYYTPDVTADFSNVQFEELAPNMVSVRGGNGNPRPDRLKVSVGYRDGFRGEGQITYAGPGAVRRGQLALDIVQERLKLTGVPVRKLRAELIGINSIHARAAEGTDHRPCEVRARVAGRTWDREAARAIADEVETLYTNGPAGGGGVSKDIREVLAIASAYIRRSAVTPAVKLIEVRK